MACFASVRAGHGGVAALRAAARSGTSIVLVCPTRGRAEAVAAALQAATKGTGLVLSASVVARAAKRSGAVEDAQGDDRTSEDVKAAKVFFVGAGDNRTGEEVTDDGDVKAANDIFFVEAGEEVTDEDVNGPSVFFVGGGHDRAGERVNKDDIKGNNVGDGDDPGK